MVIILSNVLRVHITFFYTGAEKKDLDNFKNLIISLNYPMERTEERETTTEQEDTKKDAEVATELLKVSFISPTFFRAH